MVNSVTYRRISSKRGMIMMDQIQNNSPIIVNMDSNSQNRNYKISSTYHKTIIYDDNDNNNTTSQKQQPCIHDRVKLIYLDYEYSGLTQGICGTITGIASIKEAFRSINRPESIIWVKWDNGIELGLIEGIDKYEVVSDTAANATQTAQTINDSAE
jgi:hypothetical protein